MTQKTVTDYLKRQGPREPSERMREFIEAARKANIGARAMATKEVRLHPADIHELERLVIENRGWVPGYTFAGIRVIADSSKPRLQRKETPT